MTPTTPTAASVYQQLRTHLVDLKLADAADALPKVLDQAQAEGWTLTTALERLLQIEVTATDARRLAGRFRFANLPTGATLEDFDHDAASGIDRSLLAELATCRSIDTATNVLLIGPPGVGKTHIATGLGHAAVNAGYRVYFTSAADLAARCHRAAIEGKWATMNALLRRPDAADHRRARLPATARRGRLRPLPGHQPALHEDFDRAHHQPARRRLGRDPRRHHRRSSHARPTPPPISRDHTRRGLLPAPQPPRRSRRTPPRHHQHQSALALPRDLGNFGEQLWGDSLSAVTSSPPRGADVLNPSTARCCSRRPTILS